VAALHAKLKQASQYNEVDHGATNIRLSAQVEELQQKLLTMVGAKNLSDQARWSDWGHNSTSSSEYFNRRAFSTTHDNLFRVDFFRHILYCLSGNIWNRGLNPLFFIPIFWLHLTCGPQKARDAKGALKGAQDAGDAARKQLADTQYELRRALQTNESLKLKMMQNGLSTTLGSPAAAAKPTGNGATTAAGAAALAASAEAAAASAAALQLAPPAGGDTVEGGDAAAAASAPTDSTHSTVPAAGGQ
jgi:hypothetical protein